MKSGVLRVVSDSAPSSPSDFVMRLSSELESLAIEAPSARRREFLERIDATIAEACTLRRADIVALQDEISSGCRPADSQELKRQLQVLIGSFPNASKQNLAIYGVALLEDVAFERPSIAALTSACRRLRRSNTFVPTISEVLDALSSETRRQQTELDAAREFVPRLERARAAAQEARERITREFERLVDICQKRLRNFDNVNWLPAEVVKEAQERITARVVEHGRLAPAESGRP
jgi:hypothetical protein